MKSFAIALVLMSVSMSASAKFHFQTNSALPNAVKAEIISQIAKSCPETIEKNWAVSEITSAAQVIEVDQGLIDTYYTSTFEVDAKETDSNHSTRYLMNIETLMTVANNGTHINATIKDGCR